MPAVARSKDRQTPFVCGENLSLEPSRKWRASEKEMTEEEGRGGRKRRWGADKEKTSSRQRQTDKEKEESEEVKKRERVFNDGETEKDQRQERGQKPSTWADCSQWLISGWNVNYGTKITSRTLWVRTETNQTLIWKKKKPQRTSWSTDLGHDGTRITDSIVVWG